MELLIEWGYNVIQFLQAYRNPVLDTLFKVLSFMGEEEFYLLLMPLLYWVVDKRLATRFALLFLLSVYLNMVFKALVSEPRPAPGRVLVLANLSSGGLPSGHAQNGVVSAGFLAHESSWRWFRWTMGAFILGNGLSRLYLGVHFPHDVLVGWAIGGLLLLLYFAIAPRFEVWFASQTRVSQVVFGATVTLLLASLFLQQEAFSAMATLFGLAVGVPVEREKVAFHSAVRGVGQVLGRILLGLMVLLLIWRGLKPFLELFGAPGDFVRYALMGLWVSVGAPWMFAASGLASREPHEPTVREAIP